MWFGGKMKLGLCLEEVGSGVISVLFVICNGCVFGVLNGLCLVGVVNCMCGWFIFVVCLLF